MSDSFNFESLRNSISWDELGAPTKEGIVNVDVDGKNYEVNVKQQNIDDHKSYPEWRFALCLAVETSHSGGICEIKAVPHEIES